MTLSKLSLRNARRQTRDYLVYFVTIILSAALIYSFNALALSRELKSLYRQMSILPVTINLTSIAAVFLIGWLIHYTTGFMLSRRSREFGTYILIGLENQQVARMFFLENLAVGGAALLPGLLLGSLIFQALRAIVLSLFGVPYDLRFGLSLKAVGLTLLYFVFMYLFAQIKSRRKICRMKIYDLIYFERQNEKEVIEKSRHRRILFTVSLVLGVIGTLLLMMGSMTAGLLGAAFIIVFLYGFFLSFSSGVPAWFDRRPRRKYLGQTLLVFRTLTAKLATMGMTMAAVSLLFTAVLVSQGSGLTFSALFRYRAAYTTCFDLFISITEPERDFEEYLDYMEASGLPVDSSWQYEIYQGGDSAVTDYIAESQDYYQAYDKDLFMKYSDYAALRAMLGYPEVILEPGTYLAHSMPYLEKPLRTYPRPVTVGGVDLSWGGIRTELFTQYMWDGNGDSFILVVPDDVLENCPVVHRSYAAMTASPLTEAQYQGLFAIKADRREAVYVKSQLEMDSASSCAVIVFPLYYLALMLTMTAATILTVQQLSETERYQRQFRLLHKLGMDRREQNRALLQQLSIYYAMPAVPPILIGVPFIVNLGGMSEPGVLTGTSQPLAIAGVTVGMFLLIYFLYALMAYSSMRKVIE